MVRDLVAWWQSPQWRSEAEEWVASVLSTRGRRLVGPVEQPRVRSWSTQLAVPTDLGAVWFKENAPSQSFEAALVEVVHRLAPGRVVAPLGVECDRGWLLADHLDGWLWGRGGAGVDDWAGLLGSYAALQRQLPAHGAEVLASGLPAFPRSGGEVASWVEQIVDELAGLPSSDPRRLTADEVRQVRHGTLRLGGAAEELAASAIPESLQHNDLHLGNAFRAPDRGVTVIDLGDAVWAHPFATLRIPLWRMARDGHHEAAQRRVTDAYLEHWSDLAPLADLRRLLPAAERLSCLHRAESWRRLQWDNPLERVRGDFERAVADWLLVATAEDPARAAD